MSQQLQQLVESNEEELYRITCDRHFVRFFNRYKNRRMRSKFSTWSSQDVVQKSIIENEVIL